MTRGEFAQLLHHVVLYRPPREYMQGTDLCSSTASRQTHRPGSQLRQHSLPHARPLPCCPPQLLVLVFFRPTLARHPATMGCIAQPCRHLCTLGAHQTSLPPRSCGETGMSLLRPLLLRLRNLLATQNPPPILLSLHQAAGFAPQPPAHAQASPSPVLSIGALPPGPFAGRDSQNKLSRSELRKTGYHSSKIKNMIT